MAQALRQSGEKLRSQGEAQQAADVAEGAADRIERLGGYLEQTKRDALLRDVEDFARRRPWMIAGIGMLAGADGRPASEGVIGAPPQLDAGRRSPSRHGYGASPPRTVGRYVDEPLTRESYATAERGCSAVAKGRSASGRSARSRVI